MKKVHFYLYLDVRKTLKNGEHPICLVVNSGGRRKFYRTGYSATEKYYEKCMNAKRGQAKEDRQEWEEYEGKAKAIIEQLKVFTFVKFERLFLSKHSADLKGYFDARITELTKAKTPKIGTANVYSDSKKSLFKYKPDLNFNDIDAIFLEDYQDWMESKGRSATTIGMYIRSLRAIFNQAIKDGSVKRELYPFDDYTIPQGENRKMALNLSQLSALKSYKPLPNEKFHIDLWWLSFYMAGANLKDILKLKWTDIKDDSIQFIRQKTARTQRKTTKIKIPIDDYIQSFIDTYGQKDGDYILYLYNEEKDPAKRDKKGKQLNKMINDRIKKAGKAVGVNGGVTLYTARHSYASLLNERNVPLSYIKETLGHTDISTTQKYLASIDKEKEKEYRGYLKIG